MLTRRLLKQGYRYDHLCSCFKRFYNKHVDISTKYKITVKQHIKEGIELPLSSVKRLNRLITTRHSSCTTVL